MIKAYLTLYNVAQFVGWSYILFQIVRIYSEGKSPAAVWPVIGTPLFYIQNAAVLEVVHALIGFVRTPISTTFVQVLSRVALVAIAVGVPQIQSHWIITLMVTSWSLTEVVRYLYYALQQFSEPPYLLLWLRYSLFLVLYPSGVAGEVGTIYYSLPYVTENGLFGFSEYGPILRIVLIVALITYIPGLPYMYTHMMRQRKRYLSPTTKKDADKKKRK